MLHFTGDIEEKVLLVSLKIGLSMKCIFLCNSSTNYTLLKKKYHELYFLLNI